MRPFFWFLKLNSSSSGSTISHYVRDAQGNVLAVYQYKANTLGTLTEGDWTEQHLYGSSRLDMLMPHVVIPSAQKLATDAYDGTNDHTEDTGNRLYELTNHLGNTLVTISNTLVTISDKLIPLLPVNSVATNSADIVSAQDYYPFGMQMPGRTYLATGSLNYRYGFNGKENDNEVEGVGNQIDYGMRVYDPRIGKFLSVDPLTKKYPWYTPYQFAGNTPIEASDLDGAEPAFNMNDMNRAEKEADYAIYGETEGERQFQIYRKGQAFGSIAGVALAADWFLFRGAGTRTALTTLSAWQVSEVYEYANRNSNQRDPKIRAENSRMAGAALANVVLGWGIGKIFGTSISFFKGLAKEDIKYLFRGDK